MSLGPTFLLIALLFVAAGATNLYSARRKPDRRLARRWLALSCFAWAVASALMATGGTPFVVVFALLALSCMVGGMIAAARSGAVGGERP